MKLNKHLIDMESVRTLFCATYLVWTLTSIKGELQVQWLQTENSGNIDSSRESDIWSYGKHLSDIGYFPYMTNNIRFLVKACSDSFLFLQIQTNISSEYDIFEIVIGSFKGAAVSTRFKGLDPKHYSIDNLLSCSSYTPYWLCWNRSRFLLGRGFTVGIDAVLNASFPNDFEVSNVGIMTGWGSTGDWIFYFGDETLSLISNSLVCKTNNMSTLNYTTVSIETTTGNDNSGPSSLSVDLALDKTSLSSYKRKRSSAADNRLSVTAIGYVGTAVIVTVILMIVAIDVCQYNGIGIKPNKSKLK